MPRSRTVHRLVALALSACALATASPSCGLFECAKDEDNAVVACERVTEAVNEVLAGCGLSVVDATIVCGAEVCDRITGCSDRAEVDECVDAIRSVVSCTEAQDRSYTSLLWCETVFQQIAGSCSSSDDDDDWDD